MNMFSKRLGMAALAAVFAAGLAISAPASAKEGKGAEFLQAEMDRLQLTQEQQATAKKLLDEARENRAALKKAIDVKEEELDQLVTTNPTKGDEIIAMSREIGEMKGKLRASRGQLQLKLREAGLPESLAASKKDGMKGPKGMKGLKDGKGPKGMKAGLKDGKAPKGMKEGLKDGVKDRVEGLKEGAKEVKDGVNDVKGAIKGNN